MTDNEKHAARLELMIRCLNIPLAEDVAAMTAGAASLRAAQSWQPIATAPKDGTNIILTDDAQVSVGGWVSAADQGADVGEEHLISPGWWSLDGLEAFYHWMPLPLPPSREPA